MQMTSSPRPFRIDIPDAVLEKIRRKVAGYEWHEMPGDGGWQYGTNLDYMKTLCTYWLDAFDWRKQESELNSFNQFVANVDGLDIHYLYEKGSGPAPMPLLISHGWPGSIAEFTKIVDRLAHPERYGGAVDDAFDVIAPSLPGFGFSGKPARPIGPRKMAAYFHQLMTGTLGYQNYLAQGGDWGGAISSWLGFDHAPACTGIHINILTMRYAGGPQTAEEADWEARFAREQEIEDGYRAIQSTKPQSLSFAMNDSPVGIAAWIIEKFNSWSDTIGDDVESAHSKDALLTNIMIYVATGTFNTASWIYYGRREEGGRVLCPDGKRVEVPTGCALFPKEFLEWAPRSYVERLYNVTHWSEMPRGGHFAAMEEPELLAADLVKFARQLR